MKTVKTVSIHKSTIHKKRSFVVSNVQIFLYPLPFIFSLWVSNVHHLEISHVPWTGLNPSYLFPPLLISASVLTSAAAPLVSQPASASCATFITSQTSHCLQIRIGGRNCSKHIVVEIPTLSHNQSQSDLHIKNTDKKPLKECKVHRKNMQIKYMGSG